MVGLKKLLSAEKALSRPAISLGPEDCGADQPYFHMAVDSPTQSHFEGGFPSGDSQSLNVAHHFDQIEKQFEDLHDQLGRSTSSKSQVWPGSSHFAPKPKNGRHIDLMDALFSTEHYQTTASEPLSPPVSPYNEDVAERNMTRFIRIQYRNGLAKSGILSALYQEDVADRNIVKYSSPGRSLSHLGSRSSPAAPGGVRIPESQRRNARKRFPGKPSWASAENLRTKLSPENGSGNLSPRSQSHLGNCLRPQRSAPSLTADEDFVPEEDAPPASVQCLGVPPAYKQGRRWSNTPLPDSPTIPIPMGNRNSTTETPAVRPPDTIVRSTQRSLFPVQSREPSSKKNARGLSINTQLATQGRPKNAHRAIRPPTPSTSELKRAPSIAEVMDSPLPVSTPISLTESCSRFKASDVMDFLTKACKSIQSFHPTHETLQDAIVRDVNSHEAFRRVPVPSPGPPFTPVSDQDEFSNEFRPANSLHRSRSAKSRLMNKSSSKHKSNPETRRSISTSVSYDRLLRKVSGASARRRHTDAPAPTPGFLAEIQAQKEPVITRAGSKEPITYLDVLHASSGQQPISTGSCASHSASHKRGHSESVGNLAAMACSRPVVSFVPGTVHRMQAHSAPSSNSSHEDSDDEIIELPNPSPTPRVQIEGVDEKNIRYIIDAASPDEAQKLLHWPQQFRRGRASSPYGSSLSPLSRARMQLRGLRSVD
ncbi:hypothetical protein Pdw03_3408 [Penicillium digitatum]|uniref:Uncharacterized protein n=3 Tax=Penicillium digitatum TaxID=36651 RepID=K9FHN3_PEND2|nr:hypothetical protein PDIP_80620 [Penicillium digitatum Pd1]EKV06060.1 hypothetical protein PDIP_80620 [Penicillium digitatum Pd1]EKV07702.1 hypothetical protein PDIG_71320 [Penicillium digitatum PHI26]QQK40554.1 hypothetical protein Pdw03_3408 [Penicillium digitatum]